MNDLEYEFVRELQKMLKEKIRGGIYCGIYEDTLYIRIILFKGTFNFRYEKESMSEQFRLGVSKSNICEEVIKLLNGAVRKYYIL